MFHADANMGQGNEIEANWQLKVAKANEMY